MIKFLITILTSYNEHILFQTFLSIYGKNSINFNYTIVIIVNSTNSEYYKHVCEKFKKYKIEIIETESNGKPGKGHNSVIHYFKNNPEYDYLIPIDGDDFLYPHALQQLSKILFYNPTMVVGGNEDYISNFKDLYNPDNCYKLENSYFLYTEPNIYTNIQFSLNGKGTPFRLILLHKSAFNFIDTLFINSQTKLYCEKSKVFDDYLFYLHVLYLQYYTKSNIYYINLKNIYLYYKAHISSVCYQNSHNCDDDIKKMIISFPFLKKLEEINVIFKLPILYISNYNSESITYNKNTKHSKNNINIEYEIEEFIHSEEFKTNYSFSFNLSKKLYNVTLIFIKNSLVPLSKLEYNEKKKIYLLLENYILNNNITKTLLDYFFDISNHLSYIAIDIILILVKFINENDYIMDTFINDFNNNKYVSVIISIQNIFQKNINYNKNIFYYYNISCIKLDINNKISSTTNSISLSNSKQTIILLDYMDIDYIPITPYIKGLGGTQLSYIFLGNELSKYYNIIILNKKNTSEIIYMNDIYVIQYKLDNEIIEYINNIQPDIVIYNFIELGSFLKTNLNKTANKKIQLIMYEHICIYSNFEYKIKQNYYDYYDKIFFVSQNQFNTYKKYIKINEEKTIILNNGLSPIFNNNIIQYNILKQKKLSIIYISNPQRGLECFEYIFPLLKNKYPNITLEIYSSLDIYDMTDNIVLQDLYTRLSKIDGINYNKSISQFELIKKLTSSLLFIYPTFVEETFCNSMIEAMSCGCSVISTNIGALKDVAYPYGDFVDIDINKSPSHPYYESIDANYINNIVDKSVDIIDKYINNDIELEDALQKQIKFVKKKYNWQNQADNLYNLLS